MLPPDIDPRWGRRLLVALVLSIVVNVLLIGSGIIRALPVREHDEPTTRVVLETRPPQPPTPPPPTTPPTPKPTPKVVVHPQPVHTKVVVEAPTAKPRRRLGGSARPKELATFSPTAPPNGATPAAGTGVAAGGTGTGAGPGNGNGGGNGSGTEQPCGLVSFIPTGTPTYKDGKWYESIRAIVDFPDGHTETAVFPYPWIYAKQNDDPWAPQNLHNMHMHAYAQFPPPGVVLSDQDYLVKMVLQYTRPNGTTVLPLCPGQQEHE